MSHANITTLEQKIMPLVAVGLSNREIADEIHRSEHTINGYVKGLMRRFEVRNRAALSVLLVITKQICITENDLRKASRHLSLLLGVGFFWTALFQSTLTFDSSRENRRPSKQGQQSALRAIKAKVRNDDLYV